MVISVKFKFGKDTETFIDNIARAYPELKLIDVGYKDNLKYRIKMYKITRDTFSFLDFWEDVKDTAELTIDNNSCGFL